MLPPRPSLFMRFWSLFFNDSKFFLFFLSGRGCSPPPLPPLSGLTTKNTLFKCVFPKKSQLWKKSVKLQTFLYLV